MFQIAVQDLSKLDRLARKASIGWMLGLKLCKFGELHKPAYLNAYCKMLFVGTTKETRENRFSDLNDLLVQRLKQDGRCWQIHDVGVSSGITSYELHKTLSTAAISFHLTISDKYSRFYRRGTRLLRIYDGDGNLRLAYVGSLVACNHLQPRFFASKALFKLLALQRFDRSRATPFHLYAPEVTELLQRNIISEMEFDIFETQIEERFDYVRCMNVLNRAYFDEARIRTAVQRLVSSLKEGGILQIGRTHPDGANHVSFFRKTGGHLAWQSDFNQGSEIKQLLMPA